MSTDSASVNHDDAVQRDIREIKHSLGQMAEALTRIVLLEERHGVTQDAVRRIAERQDEAERLRHQRELEQARIVDLPSRVAALEAEARAAHIEREKDKARIDTFVRTVKFAWWAIAGLASSGLGLALIQFFSQHKPG